MQLADFLNCKIGTQSFLLQVRFSLSKEELLTNLRVEGEPVKSAKGVIKFENGTSFHLFDF